jgi:hypothetical protein
LVADTGWHNDRLQAAATHPLGLGFTVCGRGMCVPSREGVLRRRLSFQLCSTPQLHVGNRFYRLHRGEFALCRSQNPRADNTDVGEGKPDVQPVHKGVDSGLPKLVGATNGASTVHVNGSSSAKKDAASLSWWGRIPRRYIIVGLCFIAFLLCNMDRVCGLLLLLTRHHAFM